MHSLKAIAGLHIVQIAASGLSLELGTVAVAVFSTSFFTYVQSYRVCSADSSLELQAKPCVLRLTNQIVQRL